MRNNSWRSFLVATAAMAGAALAADLPAGKLLHRAGAAFRLLAGPAPISAPLSATNGATSATIRPIRPASPAASRPVSTGSTATSSTAPKPTSSLGAERHVRAVAVLQSVVRHRARPRRRRHRQCAGLRHRGPRLWQPDRGQPRQPVGDQSTLGWAAGVGAEVGLTPHWSAKAEWLYLDLSDRSFSVTGTNNGLTANLLRFGVNYHF